MIDLIVKDWQILIDTNRFYSFVVVLLSLRSLKRKQSHIQVPCQIIEILPRSGACLYEWGLSNFKLQEGTLKDLDRYTPCMVSKENLTEMFSSHNNKTFGSPQRIPRKFSDYPSQSVFTCSKLTIETLEQDIKYSLSN